MKEFTIRMGDVEDAEKLMLMTEELNWFSPKEDPDIEIVKSNVWRRFKNQLLLDRDMYTLYLAETPQDNIVGYASVYWLNQLYLPAPEGFITDLFVVKKFQKKGIASEFLDTINLEAQSRQCTRLMLNVAKDKSVYETKFYQKRGWDESENTSILYYWF